jgi:RHS repeat-associated protein
MGWSLELGSVERNIKSGVNYEGDDYVLRVGQSSVDLIGDTGNPGVYRPKIESDFKLIRKLLAPDGLPYWLVTDRYGTQFQYGYTALSRQDNPASASQIFKWCLNQVTDPNGNQYTITYFKDSGAIYPVIIAFSGNQVLFWLDVAIRDDKPTDYRLTFAVTTRYLLKAIEVRTPPTIGGGKQLVARAYQLAYTPSPRTGRSLLNAVQQFGSGAVIDAYGNVQGTALPPHTFSWQTQQGTWKSSELYPPPTSTSPTEPGTAIIDFNGDGRPDIVRASEGDATSAPNGAWLDTTYPGGWYPMPVYILPVALWSNGHDNGVRFADLDGDGLLDLIQGYHDYSNNTLHSHAWLNRWSGMCGSDSCAWVPADQYAPPFELVGRDGNAQAGYDVGMRLVDLDGDARADLIQGWHNQGTPVHNAWINNGGQCFTTGCAWEPVPEYAPDAEFTGRDSTAWGGWDAGLRLVDLNGDGKADLIQGLKVECVSTHDTCPHLVYNAWINDASLCRWTGCAWRQAPQYVPPAAFTGREVTHAAGGWDYGVRILDVNGDRLPDIILGFNDAITQTVTLRSWLNNGGACSTAGCAWNPADQYAPPGPIAGRSPMILAGWDYGVRFADLNGDGRPDFIHGFRTESSSGASESYTASINLNNKCTTDRCQWSYAPQYVPSVPLVRYAIHCNPWPYNECFLLPLSAALVVDVNGDGISDLISGGSDPYCVNFNGDFVCDFVVGGSTPQAWINEVPVVDGLTGATFIDAGQADLLSETDNGIGGRTSIEYRSPIATMSQMPFLLHNVSQVATTDGFGGVPAITTLSYLYGYYHAADRDFRGFNFVRVDGPVGPHGEQLQTRYWFHQGNDAAVDVNDPSGHVGYMKGKIYRKELWNLKGGVRQSNSQTLTTYWDSAGPSYFTPPRLIGTQQCDTATCGRTARTEYADFDTSGNAILAYDAWGNVLRVNEYGDVSDSKDDRTIIRTYSTMSPNYIVGLRTSETVYAGAGSGTSLVPSNQLAQTLFYYDGTASGTGDCSSTSSTTSPTKGNLTRIVRWLNGSTANPEEWRGYDAYGNLTCVSDPDRRVTAFGYDWSSSTFQTSIVNAKNHVTSMQYYGVDGVPADKGLYGQMKTVTDRNQAQTTFEYDVFGRRTTATKPPVTTPLAGDPFPGYTSTTSYYLGGVGVNRVEVSGSDGQWSAQYFDGLGRTYLQKKKGSGSTSARVISTRTYFNATGTKAAMSLPYDDTLPSTERRAAFQYDALGRVTVVNAPDGTSTLFCYRDRDGSSASVDANGHPRRQVIDVHGNVVLVEEYKGLVLQSCSTAPGTPYASTSYAYDRMGRLTTVTDAAGTPFATDYDTLGRRLFVSDPDLGTWYYGYWPSGDVQWQEDANGANARNPYKTFFYYDELHRLTLRQYPDSTSDAFGYDDPAVPYSKGKRTSMTDSSGTTAYGYDAIGRVSVTTQTIDGISYSTGVGYDSAGRVSRETYPTVGSTPASVATYQYDPDGWLSTVSVDGTKHATLTGYNVLGQVGDIGFGNGLHSLLSYYNTGNNRLHTILTVCMHGCPTFEYVWLSYDYDNVGNVMAVTDKLNGANTQSFGYDELNRLTSASSGTLGARSYSYDAIGNFETKEGVGYFYDPTKVHAVKSTTDGRSFNYDWNGNLLSDGTRTFTYDYLNRPDIIKVKGGATVSFTYDGNGRRVKKVVDKTTTVYVGRLYECTNGTCTGHVWAGDKRIASIAADSTVRYYHADILDSTRAVTDQNGALAEPIYYAPYGESPTGGTKYRYTGQERDETGLYFYGARYYNPVLGRFITADPIVQSLYDPQSLNRYAYARNNPVRFNDPTGYESEDYGYDYYSYYYYGDYYNDNYYNDNYYYDDYYYNYSYDYSASVTVLEVEQPDGSYALMDPNDPSRLADLGPEFEAVVYGQRANGADVNGLVAAAAERAERAVSGGGFDVTLGFLHGFHASQVLASNGRYAAWGFTIGYKGGPWVGAQISPVTLAAPGLDSISQLADAPGPSLSFGASAIWAGFSVQPVAVPQVCGDPGGAFFAPSPVYQVSWPGLGFDLGLYMTVDKTLWVPALPGAFTGIYVSPLTR